MEVRWQTLGVRFARATFKHRSTVLMFAKPTCQPSKLATTGSWNVLWVLFLIAWEPSSWTRQSRAAGAAEARHCNPPWGAKEGLSDRRRLPMWLSNRGKETEAGTSTQLLRFQMCCGGFIVGSLGPGRVPWNVWEWQVDWVGCFWHLPSASCVLHVGVSSWESAGLSGSHLGGGSDCRLSQPVGH